MPNPSQGAVIGVQPPRDLLHQGLSFEEVLNDGIVLNHQQSHATHSTQWPLAAKTDDENVILMFWTMPCLVCTSSTAVQFAKTGKQMKAGIVGILCFVVGVLVTPLCIWGYLSLGRPPVAVADPAFPFEKQIVRVPLHLRMESETEQAPIQPNENNLLAGAQIYKRECSFCHGAPNLPAEVGQNMYPSVPQLWQKHKNGVVGVSDDPVGITYWRVKNGIRLTGMPSYQKTLSPTQMWQVSLLLASADKPLSPSVQAALLQP